MQAEFTAKQQLIAELSGSLGGGVSSPTRFGRRSTGAVVGSNQNLNVSVLDWVASLELDDRYGETLASMASSTLDLKEMDAEDVASLGMKRMEEKRFTKALAALKE